MEAEDRQYEFIRRIGTGQICAECGEADCVDFACHVAKADMVRAVFGEVPRPARRPRLLPHVAPEDGRVVRVGRAVAAWFIRTALERRPDLIIVGSEAAPYLLRWWLIPRNRWFNVYLHLFLRSDDDRALHDHPWWNCSVLLAGEYLEHAIRQGGVNVRTRRTAGAVKLRRPGAAHRLELVDGAPCWTLFLTGPRLREWGFHCPDAGWRHWKVFTAEGDAGAIGPGCGDA